MRSPQHARTVSSEPEQWIESLFISPDEEELMAAQRAFDEVPAVAELIAPAASAPTVFPLAVTPEQQFMDTRVSAIEQYLMSMLPVAPPASGATAATPPLPATIMDQQASAWGRRVLPEVWCRRLDTRRLES